MRESAESRSAAVRAVLLRFYPHQYPWGESCALTVGLLLRFSEAAHDPTQKRAPPALSNPTPSGKTPDGRPCPPRGWLPQPFRAPPRRTSTAAAYPLKDHSTESLLMQISR